MGQLFTDGARTELVTAISTTDTTLAVLDGAKFPVANTGTTAVGPAKNWFKVVLQDAAGFEIVYVRTRAGGSNSFTNVLRGQDGTTAKAYLEGTVVGLRPTAADFAALKDRANHTGEQPISSITGLQAALDTADVDAMPKSGGTFTGNVGFRSGLNFGNLIGTSPQEVSKHINLYGNTYGLSITGSSLNYVVDATASHNFFSGAANVANLTGAGKLTVLGGVTARRGLCLVGSSPGMTADNYAAGRSIQVNTDTAAFGGPHDDHSCFAIHPYMGGGWTSGEMRVLIATSGGIYNYGSPALIVGEGGVTHKGNVTAYSDRKLKDNIETIDNALDMVNAMRGVYYTLKSDPTKRRQVGVIAQEMQDVLPEVVSSVKQDTKSDEETLVVAYANTVAVLIEAVKALSTEVNLLKKAVK